MVLRIRLQSHQVHLTMLQYYTSMQCTVIHKYTEMNLSTVKWAQWDKTQSRELLGLFICVCSSLCTTVAHNTAQNRPDNFPSCPPDNHHCSDDVYLREAGMLVSHHNDHVLAGVSRTISMPVTKATVFLQWYAPTFSVYNSPSITDNLTKWQC